VPKFTHVHIQSILLPKITYAHMKYFISIQIFLLFHSHLFIHICTLVSQSHVIHTLAFIWKGIFMSSIYTWKEIPHHIYSFWEAFSCHIQHVYIFFERLLMLPTHKYTYFERHFYATDPTYTNFWKALFAIYSHTLQGISMLYIFTYIHTIERYFPCYLDARYSSWGSLPKF